MVKIEVNSKITSIEIREKTAGTKTIRKEMKEDEVIQGPNMISNLCEILINIGNIQDQGQNINLQ